MVDRTRRKVKTMVASLDISYSTLESALEEIKRHINDYGADVTIETYEDREYLGIFKYVDETDEEMTRRIALEERYAEEKEKRDRAEFERLSKKFSQ